MRAIAAKQECAGLTALVGDIGGTHCRLALARWQDGAVTLTPPARFACADFEGAAQCIEAYLATQSLRPSHGVLAAAGPVSGDCVTLTNHPWQLRAGALAPALGLAQLHLINDFAALALAAPWLDGAQLLDLGPRLEMRPAGTIVVMGPGTGFGLAALANGNPAEVVETEAGHIGFAPADAVEDALAVRLRAQYGRVSVERILSGAGLEALHAALAAQAGLAIPAMQARAITEAARAGEDLAIAACGRFCAILGSVAGDLALALGARGGVFIAGGVAQHLGFMLGESAFRARFEDKGRFAGFMAAIPTRLITAPFAALHGAARCLESRFAGRG